MKKNFLRYFGFSLQRRESQNGDWNFGFSIIIDEIVYLGFVFSLGKYNLGLWVHRKGFIVSNKGNTI